MDTNEDGCAVRTPPPTFRRWLRGINPGFYTYCSWSWLIGGTLVTHWPNDLVKIYHQGGRHTEAYPASSERCREAIHALFTRHPNSNL